MLHRIISDKCYGHPDQIDITFEFDDESRIRCCQSRLETHINLEQWMIGYQNLAVVPGEIKLANTAIIPVPSTITFLSIVALMDHIHGNVIIAQVIDVGQLMDAADWLGMLTDKITLPRNITIIKVVPAQLMFHKIMLLKCIYNSAFMYNIIEQKAIGLIDEVENVAPIITAYSANIKKADVEPYYRPAYIKYENDAVNPIAVIHAILRIRDMTHLMNFMCNTVAIRDIFSTEQRETLIYNMLFVSTKRIIYVMGATIYLDPKRPKKVDDGWHHMIVLYNTSGQVGVNGVAKEASSKWINQSNIQYPCVTLSGIFATIVFGSSDDARIKYHTP